MPMILVLVLSLQEAAVATPAADAPPAAPHPGAGQGAVLDFDLAHYRSSESATCPGAAGSEVLVCGRRRGRGADPIDYWDRIFGPERPIRAEMDLGDGVVGRAYVEDVAMDRGAVSHRVMVGIRMPF